MTSLSSFNIEDLGSPADDDSLDQIPLATTNTTTGAAAAATPTSPRRISEPNQVVASPIRREPSRLKRGHSLSFAAKQEGKLPWQDKMLFQRLILRLAKALFQYGAPSYRVERRIQMIAKTYNIPVEIICQPSYILISFGDFGLSLPDSLQQSMNGSIGNPPASAFLQGGALQNTFFLKVSSSRVHTSHLLPFLAQVEQVFNMGKLQDIDYLATQIASIPSSSQFAMELVAASAPITHVEGSTFIHAWWR